MTSLIKRLIRIDKLPFFLWNQREQMMKVVMDFVMDSRLEGDYVEFGVYRGKSFIDAYYFARTHPELDGMKFWALDSFKGIPEIKGVDVEGFRHFHRGQYACSLEDFKKRIRKLEGIEIIEGNWNSFDSLPTKKVAVVMIDCDVYISAKSALNLIKDKLQDGSVLIFDDWFCFRGNPNRGEQRAFKEWIQENNINCSEFYRYGTDGKVFIIHQEKI